MGWERYQDVEYIDWAKAIKVRDRHICQVCFKNSGLLHSHHLFSFDKYIELRYVVGNGICLCHLCHQAFHQAYGKGNNTGFQFIEFLKSRQMMLESLRKEENGSAIKVYDGYNIGVGGGSSAFQVRTDGFSEESEGGVGRQTLEPSELAAEES